MPAQTRGQLVLNAKTAADLMTPNLISFNESMTVHEAATFLTEREISAAPVIDAAGRAIGVLSRTDLVRYSQAPGKRVTACAEFYEKAELGRPAVRTWPEQEWHEAKSILIEPTDRTLITEIMTPTVLSVTPETPALEVVAQMLALKIHRLFVQDASGVLVGVVSVFDVLRRLKKR
jgi:CBS domain-containing protein